MSIRVLVVDDSAVVRQTLERELGRLNGIEVIGTAHDPYIARDKILQLKPDVLTLDVEMPRMDGITFLHRLMKHHPLPVIIVSSIAKEGSPVALEAIDAGAVDVIAKPGAAYSVGDMAVELGEKIRAAATVNLKQISELKKGMETSKRLAPQAMSKTTDQIVAVGASTGGTQAIECYLLGMPANCPPTVIVQHMPAGFTKSFAERLNQVCQPEVKEAADGDTIIPGRVLVAPGHSHMLVRRSGAKYFVEVKDGPLVDRHRPSVSVLFQSVAQNVGRNSVCVMLTGMGTDGAKGMLAIKNAGGRTIAQDEKSCVVYGMPRAAVEIGAVEQSLPLDRIAGKVLEIAEHGLKVQN
jgi:two-component system chemotaxis response regulator CheB